MLKKFPNNMAINPGEIIGVRMLPGNDVLAILKTGDSYAVAHFSNKEDTKKYYNELVDELNGVKPSADDDEEVVALYRDCENVKAVFADGHSKIIKKYLDYLDARSAIVDLVKQYNGLEPVGDYGVYVHPAFVEDVSLKTEDNDFKVNITVAKHHISVDYFNRVNDASNFACELKKRFNV